MFSHPLISLIHFDLSGQQISAFLPAAGAAYLAPLLGVMLAIAGTNYGAAEFYIPWKESFFPFPDANIGSLSLILCSPKRAMAF